MNAPMIWIVLPGMAALAFWAARRKRGQVTLIATIFCLALSAVAMAVPIGQRTSVGPLAFQIGTTLDFFGRRLVLENGDRTLLAFVFFFCSFWFAGSYPAGTTNLFIPFGLGMACLLTASLAVEPFLYAALLFEMAVLLAVPILVSPGENHSQGVLRFLIFQTLAMPFILLAGWATAGVEVAPSDTTLIQLAMAFLGLGFAFWLAVFPFHTWIPLLAEQAFPYATGFIFLILPTTSLLLGQDFLSRFGWIRSSPGIFQMISLLGLLMIVTAGVWAAFQNELGRLFGYAFIVEAGFSLLAASLSSPQGQILFSAMLLPRVLAAGLWALSLSVLRKHAPSTRFEDMLGISQKFPYASTGLAVASLTMAGLPLLAMFPVRLALLEELARQSLPTALLASAGIVGMMFSTFRSLAVLARGRAREQSVCESRLQITLLVGGIASLVIVGLFPHVFLPIMNGLLAGYAPLR